MKKSVALALSAALCLVAQTAPVARPKLLLVLVVDQFRYDYLTRFRSEFHGGFERLLTHGAVFTNANYDHFPTITAVGHSTILTGATPSISGIVGNEWFDREAGKRVTSVSDDATKLLGGSGKGSSPRRLMVSTVADELKMAGFAGKIIGISIKDRSAILPAGHTADAAYWFDVSAGAFVTSTYYEPDLPAWVKSFNAAKPADRFAGVTWKSVDASRTFATMNKQTGGAFYSSLERSPYGNELIEDFAESAVEHEQLGRNNATDVLTISFSANDYVGHAVGPDAPEVHDMTVRTDALLEKLFAFVDKQIGLDNVLVVMTADHGVAPLPEVQAKRNMPGQRLPITTLVEPINRALSARFGDGRWIVGNSGPAPYFSRELMREKKATEAEVEQVAADSIREVPGVFRVYTREELSHGPSPRDVIDRRVMHGFNLQRGADLFIVAMPYCFFETDMSDRGAEHGSPFNYDTHVPVIFMGRGIKPGRYDRNIVVNDIAPTLATILDVQTPSGASGRVLDEMLAH